MTSSYSSVVLADTPKAYFRLNESAGPTAADSSGNGMAGNYSGASNTYGSSGLITSDSDKSVVIGTAGLLTVPDTTDLTAFSAEAWIKGPSTGTILARDTITGARIFLLWINGGAAQIMVFKGGSTAQVTGAGAINDNVRHHIVATYDGVTTRLYVDGLETGTASTLVSGALSTTDVPLTMAGRGTANEATGTFDEVAYYTYALSSARVMAHYRAGVSYNNYNNTLVASLLPQPVSRSFKSSLAQASSSRPSSGQLWPRPK